MYDASRDYLLPFRAGQAKLVSQGYGGFYSHQGQFALDFAMQAGTPISAARSGSVIEVVEMHSRACPVTKDCSNNKLIIDHLDGSRGVYLHMRQNGVCVQPNDWVNQGDVIAYSGNVGNSTMAHLHFAVKFQTDFEPVVPRFADVNAGGTGIPRELFVYRSSNVVGSNFCE